MSDHVLGVFIEGEPYRSRAERYRKLRIEAEIAWSEFALANGASGYIMSSRGLCFNTGKTPDGWLRPKGRNAFSRPHKANAEAIAALNALPKPPDARSVFGDDVPNWYEWTGPNGERGSSVVGYFFEGPRIGWAGDALFAYVPDVKTAALSHLANYPKHQIENGADRWSLPAGLRAASEAEINLTVAEFQVAQQRQKAAAS